MLRCLLKQLNMIVQRMICKTRITDRLLDAEVFRCKDLLGVGDGRQLSNMMNCVYIENPGHLPPPEVVAKKAYSEVGEVDGNSMTQAEMEGAGHPVLRLIRSTSDVKRYVDCSVKPPSMMGDGDHKSTSAGNDGNRLTASRSVSLPFDAASVEPQKNSCHLHSTNVPHASIAHRNRSATIPTGETNYDVFLGGSCNPTTWRAELAIPQLKKLNISYYNPQMSTWHPGMVVVEEAAKESSRVLFFVIDNQTRAVASMVEACYLVSSCRKLMLIVNALTNSSLKICDDALSPAECEELNQTRAYLSELVELMGLPLFLSVPAALGSIEQVLHNANHSHTPLNFEEDSKQRSGPMKPENFLSGCGSRKSVKNSLSPVELRQLCEVFAGGKLMTYDQTLQMVNRFTGRNMSAANLTEILRHVSQDFTDINDQCDSGCHQSHSHSPDSSRGYVSFRMFCALCNHIRRDSHSDGRLRLAGKPNSVTRLYRLLSKSASKVLSKPRSVADVERPTLSRLDPIEAGFSEATRSRVGLFGDHSLPRWIEEYATPKIIQKELGVEIVNGSLAIEKKPNSVLRFMSSCDWLMFSLTGKCRGALLLCLAAHSIGAGFKTVICMQNLSDGSTVHGERISPTAVKDYNRGRSYLKATAEREGVSIFQTPEEALQHIMERYSSSPN